MKEERGNQENLRLNKKPTNFLPLPSELREQILFDSVNDVVRHNLNPNVLPCNVKQIGAFHVTYSIWWAIMSEVRPQL